MFNPDVLLASLLWGSLGMGFCVYGKKRGAAVPLIGGLALLAISYLISSALLMSVLGGALVGGVVWLRRHGVD